MDCPLCGSPVIENYCHASSYGTEEYSYACQTCHNYCEEFHYGCYEIHIGPFSTGWSHHTTEEERERIKRIVNMIIEEYKEKYICGQQ